jgi:hypothetical protein
MNFFILLPSGAFSLRRVEGPPLHSSALVDPFCIPYSTDRSTIILFANLLKNYQHFSLIPRPQVDMSPDCNSSPYAAKELIKAANFSAPSRGIEL